MCYCLGEQKFRKYLGIILRSDLNRVEKISHKGHKAWKVIHFAMRFLIKGNGKKLY